MKRTVVILKKPESDYISELQSQLGSANGTINSLNSQITAKTNELANANSSISSLGSQLTTANGTINSLNTQLSTANGTINSLNTQLSTASTQLTTANNTVSSLNSQLTTANNTISSLNNTVSSLNSQLTTANSNVATLTTQLTTANDRFTMNWLGTWLQANNFVITIVSLGGNSLRGTDQHGGIYIGSYEDYYGVVNGHWYGTISGKYGATNYPATGQTFDFRFVFDDKAILNKYTGVTKTYVGTYTQTGTRQ